MWCDYSHACTHTCIPIHAHAHTLLCATRPQWTRAATQAGHALFAYPANTQACLHTHTHTRAHTHACAHACTHAHTNTSRTQTYTVRWCVTCQPTHTDIHRTLVCHLSIYAHRHTPYAGVSPVNLRTQTYTVRWCVTCQPAHTDIHRTLVCHLSTCSARSPLPGPSKPALPNSRASQGVSTHTLHGVQRAQSREPQALSTGERKPMLGGYASMICCQHR